MSNPQEPHQPGQNPPPFPPPGYGGPQQAQPPQWQPQWQPPAKSRKGLWIVLGIVGGVLVLVVIGVLVLVNVVGGATNRARSLADEFTTLVVKGQTDEAYDNYIHPALQAEIDKESFKEGIQGLELDASCKPNYSSVNVKSENGSNSADIAGTLQCSGKSIELRYVFEGTDELKMSSIRLRP
ncbi:hypothetical protein [Arthrobacter sp. CJ23]|uniref:hypothetical protein n=1 Tax=Arthrobacter sp. CJ23 TaxID=2972479 RepID=UPI00215CD026|nr:hypothetical protein [Arthrobacter sp. CJ23]UVJ40867.1 hypothetical protein NVV90_06790 [Arthrobacter sp. CJ23]